MKFKEPVDLDTSRYEPEELQDCRTCSKTKHLTQFALNKEGEHEVVCKQCVRENRHGAYRSSPYFLPE